MYVINKCHLLGEFEGLSRRSSPTSRIPIQLHQKLTPARTDISIARVYLSPASATCDEPEHFISPAATPTFELNAGNTNCDGGISRSNYLGFQKFDFWAVSSSVGNPDDRVDRMNEMPVELDDSVRRRCSVLQWHPDFATQLIVDDSSPSLRFVSELPAGTNWNFDVHWYSMIPGIILASSFDGKVGIYNIEACARYGTGENYYDQAPLKAPKWYQHKAGVSFGFGGKLVSFHTIGSSGLSDVVLVCGRELGSNVLWEIAQSIRGRAYSVIWKLVPTSMNLSAFLSNVGLNIGEAYVFSTIDGYSLDVFAVDG
ncbi:hypothetical protein LXL04_024737 [Taraxacum kok-saghyz]